TNPIVFFGGWDPLKAGIVTSLSRPGGNATGVSALGRSLDIKRLEVLRDLLPAATKIGILVNLKQPDAQSLIKEVQAAGAVMGTTIQTVNAGSEAEIDTAFAALRQSGANALIVTSESLFITRRDQIVAPAARNKLPTC